MTENKQPKPIGYTLINQVKDPVCDVHLLEQELEKRGLPRDEVKAKPLTEVKAWGQTMTRTAMRRSNYGDWSVAPHRGQIRDHIGTCSIHIAHSQDDGHADSNEAYVVVWRKGIGCHIRPGKDLDDLKCEATVDPALAAAIEAASRTASITQQRFQRWNGRLSAVAVSRLITRTITKAQGLALGPNGGSFYIPAGPVADHMIEVLGAIRDASKATAGYQCAAVHAIPQWPSPQQAEMLEDAATHSLGTEMERLHRQIQLTLSEDRGEKALKGTSSGVQRMMRKADYYRERMGVRLQAFDDQVKALQKALGDAEASLQTKTETDEDPFAQEEAPAALEHGAVTSAVLRKACRMAKASGAGMNLNGRPVTWDAGKYQFSGLSAQSINGLIKEAVEAGIAV